MTEPNMPVTEDELHAYIDNELPAERRSDVEAWLSGDRPKRPTLEQRVADLEAKVASLLQREGAV